MKKILSLLLSAVLCLNLGMVSAFAESDTIRARHLASAATDAYDGYKITELPESRTVKKSAVTVAADEMLLIRKGATLRLYQGARVDGVIYVENGAKLLLSGGTLTVSGGGAVFSDGTFSVGSKGVVSVLGGGEVFIGKKGRLKINKEDSLQFDPLANVICLGKNDSENSAIGKKAVAAYVSEEGAVTAAEKPSKLLPTGTDYCTDLTYKLARNRSAVTYVFDSGATLRALRSGEKFAVIGNCSTALVGMYTREISVEGNSGAHYCRVYEIEGKDYIWDLEAGGMTVLLAQDGTFTETDGAKPTGVLADLNKNNCKSLGKLGNYSLGDGMDAEAYLTPDGTVLAMEREQNPPPELLNAPKETLDRLYNVYLFRLAD